MNRLSRRAFLAGLGSSALLPLSFAGKGHAQGAHPKRLVIFFTPNGTVPDTWSPYPGQLPIQNRVETGHPFSPILAPLEAHRDDIIIVEGVGQHSTKRGPGDGHQKGMGHMLTGMPLQTSDLFQGGGDSGTAGWAGGISVDQHIANAVGNDTAFRSLEFGVRVTGATVWSRMCYAGPGQPIPPENDPNAAYQRIFSDFQTTPEELRRRTARRQSVLDAVRGDFNSLIPTLGAEDRVKLEQHHTAIRELEDRLSNSNFTPDACAVPEMAGPIDHMNPANFPLVGQLQMDQLAMSLACGLTNVASIQWDTSVGGINMTWEGITEGHHALSHEGDDNADAQDKLTRINTWYATQFAYLVNKLKSIPEGDGTLLDNTVILWTNELGKGNSHTRNDMPYVLAGSCGGYFNTGRYVFYRDSLLLDDGPAHNNMLLSLCAAMDVPTTTFGLPEFCDGPLPELT